MSGLFITLEGGEGAGKSTQCSRLTTMLQQYGAVLATREPGGTPEAEAVRNLVVRGNANWDPITETMLFAAARREHLVGKILPALKDDISVVCDRYVASTLALQGARGVSRDIITGLHAQFCFNRYPDLTIIMDIDPTVGLARARGREVQSQAGEDRFERLGLAFHQRVRASFLSQAAAAPERHLVVQADADPDVVTDRLLSAVSAWLAPQKAAA